MFYLQNFLFIFSLRFGCRVMAYAELCIYSYCIYYMATQRGFDELWESMVSITLITSLILAVLMLVSTLQEHESTGIIFTYIMWGIFTTIFLDIVYVVRVSINKLTVEAFVALLVFTTAFKGYATLVVISFMHQLITSDSEDSA